MQGALNQNVRLSLKVPSTTGRFFHQTRRTLLYRSGRSTPLTISMARIFVAGPASGAGKSTISLALLGGLLESGLYKPEDLAYIKPATQGTQQTLTARYCKSKNIASEHVGPLVFYKGFTRKFLDGKTEDTATILNNIKVAVDNIAQDKKVTIIDGVGHPGVGSIVGASNADVAKACNASVLIVGKEGVGACVDTFNLNAAIFELKAVPVLGLLVNRVSDNKKFLEKMQQVYVYFEKFRPDMKVYGMLKENDAFALNLEGYSAPGEHNTCTITFGAPDRSKLVADPASEEELALCSKFITAFLEAIQVESLKQLVSDAAAKSESA